MSDRGRVMQGAQTAPEGQAPLGELSASRDLHKTSPQTPLGEVANQSDLTSATLSSANVIRVPHSLSAHHAGARNSVSPQTSMSTDRDIARSTRPSKGPHSSNSSEQGVITNPTYKYSGGLVSKLISFIANILKVIERFFLRLLMGPDRAAPAPNQQPRSADAARATATSPDQSKQEREKRERAQTIVRS